MLYQGVNNDSQYQIEYNHILEIVWLANSGSDQVVAKVR